MSDEDFFQSSQREIRKVAEVPRHYSKTQPQPSDVEYFWVIVFHWDIENPNPFSLQHRNAFGESDIPKTWFIFKLRDDLRMKKKYYKVLNGHYSVFCKVEKGKNDLIFFNDMRRIED